MKVFGLIPARGGSKGVPGKNIRPLAGKSLVQRTFECAQESGAVDRIMLSTDDSAIAEAARGFGLEVPFLRPADLARDESPMIDVALHALTALKERGYWPDAVLLLQPTSPLRRPRHIQQAISLLDANDSVCSVTLLPKDLCPHYLLKIREDGYLDYFMPDGARYTRRQDVPQACQRDGTVYLTRSEVIVEQRTFYGRRCVPMVIPREESLTIDDPEDWDEAERHLQAHETLAR
jgi:CMP-N,N'-diacetyllegionaminic acid synthase